MRPDDFVSKYIVTVRQYVRLADIRPKKLRIEDTSQSFIRPLIHMRIILYENATKWLDGWLDERRWCAEPPHFSSLSGCAYGFEPRTLCKNVDYSTFFYF